MADSIVVFDLKKCESNLDIQMKQLNILNNELEKIQRVINILIKFALSSERINNINFVITEIKKELLFIDNLDSLLDDLPTDSKEALWKILSIIQDVFSDKESEKENIEEEISRLRLELQEIIEVLKEGNGKRR